MPKPSRTNLILREQQRRLSKARDISQAKGRVIKPSLEPQIRKAKVLEVSKTLGHNVAEAIEKRNPSILAKIRTATQRVMVGPGKYITTLSIPILMTLVGAKGLAQVPGAESTFVQEIITQAKAKGQHAEVREIQGRNGKEKVIAFGAIEEKERNLSKNINEILNNYDLNKRIGDLSYLLRTLINQNKLGDAIIFIEELKTTLKYMPLVERNRLDYELRELQSIILEKQGVDRNTAMQVNTQYELTLDLTEDSNQETQKKLLAKLKEAQTYTNQIYKFNVIYELAIRFIENRNFVNAIETISLLENIATGNLFPYPEGTYSIVFKELKNALFKAQIAPLPKPKEVKAQPTEIFQIQEEQQTIAPDYNEEKREAALKFVSGVSKSNDNLLKFRTYLISANTLLELGYFNDANNVFGFADNIMKMITDDSMLRFHAQTKTKIESAIKEGKIKIDYTDRLKQIGLTKTFGERLNAVKELIYEDEKYGNMSLRELNVLRMMLDELFIKAKNNPDKFYFTDIKRLISTLEEQKEKQIEKIVNTWQDSLQEIFKADPNLQRDLQKSLEYLIGEDVGWLEYNANDRSWFHGTSTDNQISRKGKFGLNLTKFQNYAKEHPNATLRDFFKLYLPEGIQKSFDMKLSLDELFESIREKLTYEGQKVYEPELEKVWQVVQTLERILKNPNLPKEIKNLSIEDIFDLLNSDIKVSDLVSKKENNNLLYVILTLAPLLLSGIITTVILIRRETRRLAESPDPGYDINDSNSRKRYLKWKRTNWIINNDTRPQTRHIQYKDIKRNLEDIFDSMITAYWGSITKEYKKQLKEILEITLFERLQNGSFELLSKELLDYINSFVTPRHRNVRQLFREINLTNQPEDMQLTCNNYLNFLSFLKVVDNRIFDSQIKIRLLETIMPLLKSHKDSFVTTMTETIRTINILNDATKTNIFEDLNLPLELQPRTETILITEEDIRRKINEEQTARGLNGETRFNSYTHVLDNVYHFIGDDVPEPNRTHWIQIIVDAFRQRIMSHPDNITMDQIIVPYSDHVSIWPEQHKIRTYEQLTEFIRNMNPDFRMPEDLQRSEIQSEEITPEQIHRHLGDLSTFNTYLSLKERIEEESMDIIISGELINALKQQLMSRTGLQSIRTYLQNIFENLDRLTPINTRQKFDDILIIINPNSRRAERQQPITQTRELTGEQLQEDVNRITLEIARHNELMEINYQENNRVLFNSWLIHFAITNPNQRAEFSEERNRIFFNTIENIRQLEYLESNKRESILRFVIYLSKQITDNVGRALIPFLERINRYIEGNRNLHISSEILLRDIVGIHHELTQTPNTTRFDARFVTPDEQETARLILRVDEIFERIELLPEFNELVNDFHASALTRKINWYSNINDRSLTSIISNCCSLIIQKIPDEFKINAMKFFTYLVGHLGVTESSRNQTTNEIRTRFLEQIEQTLTSARSQDLTTINPLLMEWVRIHQNRMNETPIRSSIQPTRFTRTVIPSPQETHRPRQKTQEEIDNDILYPQVEKDSHGRLLIVEGADESADLLGETLDRLNSNSSEPQDSFRVQQMRRIKQFLLQFARVLNTYSDYERVLSRFKEYFKSFDEKDAHDMLREFLDELENSNLLPAPNNENSSINNQILGYIMNQIGDMYRPYSDRLTAIIRNPRPSSAQSIDRIEIMPSDPKKDLRIEKIEMDDDKPQEILSEDKTPYERVKKIELDGVSNPHRRFSDLMQERLNKELKLDLGYSDVERLLQTLNVGEHNLENLERFIKTAKLIPKEFRNKFVNRFLEVAKWEGNLNAVLKLISELKLDKKRIPELLDELLNIINYSGIKQNEVIEGIKKLYDELTKRGIKNMDEILIDFLKHMNSLTIKPEVRGNLKLERVSAFVFIIIAQLIELTQESDNNNFYKNFIENVNTYYQKQLEKAKKNGNGRL